MSLHDHIFEIMILSSCVLLVAYLSTVVSASFPPIGAGTAALGRQHFDVVCRSIWEGFMLIDTAQAYEWYNEGEAGRAIQDAACYQNTEQHQQLIVVTKVHPRSYGPQALKDSLIQSSKRLRKLGTREGVKSLDAVLLHAPYCHGNAWKCSKTQERYTWQNAWQALQDFKFGRDGKFDVSVRWIGVSNFDIGLLQELIRIGERQGLEIQGQGQQPEYLPDLVQNWMDPFHQDAQVRAFCRERGVQYMAYSSFGTQWGGAYAENPVFGSAELRQIALEHSTTVANVVLAWLFQLNVTALPRSVNQEHIAANAALFLNLEQSSPAVRLSGEDMERIRALDGTLGNPWD